jgi:hypothetical protein
LSYRWQINWDRGEVFLRPRAIGDWGMPYYEEVKWCARCRKYVRYLLSLKGSYCVDCGAEVCLFSKKDLQEFKRALKPS